MERKKEIAYRNLTINAICSISIGMIALLFSANAWRTNPAMPAKVTPELHEALREAYAAAVFVAFPLLSVWLFASAIGIWLQIRRLRKTDAIEQSRRPSDQSGSGAAHKK